MFDIFNIKDLELAIQELNRLYPFVSNDIQLALDLAIDVIKEKIRGIQLLTAAMADIEKKVGEDDGCC